MTFNVLAELVRSNQNRHSLRKTSLADTSFFWGGGRALLEKAIYRHPQKFTQLEQHSCADTIGGSFIFLKLLMTDPQKTRQLGQRVPPLQTELSHIFTDNPVHVIGGTRSFPIHVPIRQF